MRSVALHRILRAISGFMLFFLTIGFAMTCCMILFLTVLSRTMGFEFTRSNVSEAAGLTLLNVLLLSAMFSLFDFIRRRISVDKPVRIITEAAERIMKGDFSVRISPIHGASYEGFNQIISAIDSMAKELSGIETLRSDFIADVSHEMKAPLSVIQNYGKLLQAPDLSDEKRIQYAKGIADASRRTADMMTNILKLNRIENQQLFTKTEVFDLGEQLCECLLRFESTWEKKEIGIEVDIAENVLVRADPELLSLVWNNLFSNAFKFTGNGGIVSVSLEERGNQARVTVKDTGCGMTPEVGERIFDKFYQGDTSHATEGNGLGLALVRRVIDIMDGEISVESAAGKGSAFTVTIEKA